MTLEEISEGNATLVKIDTDWYDFSIIRSGIEWLSRVQPLLYYENEIRDLNDLNQASTNYSRQVVAGVIFCSHVRSYSGR